MLFEVQKKEVEGRELKLYRLTADKKLRKVRWSPLSETGQKSDSMFATIIRTALFYTILFTLFRTEFFQYPDSGKIQGDGRKFLDSFKSYFGSQISSQSLNEVHIYQLQPKSATKGDFYFCLCFESASHGLHWMANEANEVLLGKLQQLKTTKNVREKIAIWEHWVLSTIVLPKHLH